VAMRLMSPEEFETELNQRNCTKLAETKSGYTIWETEDGDPLFGSPSRRDGIGGTTFLSRLDA
jgi:hypothetical protein